MPVTKSVSLLASTLCLLLGSAAFAQDAAAPAQPSAPAQAEAPAADAAVPDGLSMGRDPEAAAAAPADAPADGIGSTYVAAKHGDWDQRCVRTEDGADPCQLYQLLKDDQGNPVAELSVFGLPKGQQAAAGATLIVPLETLLTEELTLQVDTGKPRKYPFSWCSSIGCIARVGFTAAEVDGFRKGNKARVTIVPVVAPDQKVGVDVSLKGFTAGYDAVNVANGN